MQSIIPPFPLFTDEAGKPLDDGYVWIGTAGHDAETNPIAVYWDKEKTIAAGQPIRTKFGYGYRDGTASLFYADADDYSIVIKNKRSRLVFSSTQFLQLLGSAGVFLQSGTGAVQRSAQSKMREVVSVSDFTSDESGLKSAQFNAGTAFQLAISAALARGGGTVFVPNGRYLMGKTATDDDYDYGVRVAFTTIEDPVNRIRIVGESRGAILLAGANDMAVLRFGDCMGGVENLSIDADGHTNVVGLAVVPDNMNQTTTRVAQNYNVFRNLFINGCAEGIVLRCGPGTADTGSGDSGCWYNRFDDIRVNNCSRGIWLRDGATARANVNRNIFTACRIGQGNANTGLQIDSGDTNEFHGCRFEGIKKLTSPNARPTAVFIRGASVVGSGDNNSNRFFGATVEACELGLFNGNVYSEFYGCYFGSTVKKRQTTGSNPTGDSVTASTAASDATVTFSAGDLLAEPIVYGGNYLILETGADAGEHLIASVTDATHLELVTPLTATASGIGRRIESRKLEKYSIDTKPRIMIGGYDATGTPQITDFWCGQGGGGILGVGNGSLILPTNKLEFLADLTFARRSTDPHVLDDYKEGGTAHAIYPWNPTLTATGASGYTYAQRRAQYRKVGKTVFFEVHIQLSGFTSAGGDFVKITGFPFKSRNSSGYNAIFTVVVDFLTGLSAGDQIVCAMGAGVTECGFYVQNSGVLNRSTGLTGTELTVDSLFDVSGHYESDDTVI